MSTLRLILGDQLNPCHSWFEHPDDQVIYTLIECHQETGYVLHHGQKILAIFAAMRDFAQELQKKGHRVHYLAIDDKNNRQDLNTNLLALAEHYECQRIEYQEPDERRVDQLLSQLSEHFAGPVVSVSTEHFYTHRQEGVDVFQKKQWLLERFYRYMRQRHQILMTAEGEPEGGQWNYDEENREPYRGQVPFVPLKVIYHDHQALWQTIQKAGVTSFGQVPADAFIWPLNRQEALLYLDHFMEERLAYFGRFQDAMVAGQPFMFHSLLSFALNTKMLHPREVVERALAQYYQGKAPLASVEGFVRQIVGWREYVRVFYWAHDDSYSSNNFFKHNQSLPAWFWTGKTKMRCVEEAIGQSLTHAYAHHIHRLMIIGNVSLLFGLSPQEVSAWYLGVYIDAFEWVEEPNTLGMSQFADGGELATKPYLASAAYVHRMSDYCKGCHYDHRLKVEDHACPLNALYWHFHQRHQDVLSRNPRLSMVYRQWAKFSPEQQLALMKKAEHTLAQPDRC